MPAIVRHDSANACAALLKTGITRLANTKTGVQVDASGVSQFDSSALAVLLQARREALAQGSSFQVLGMPAAMQRLAQVYGVHELLG